uniref:WW domain-containing protein n=1 Tax=Salarias fasciatus TaxID=181472 RepID=A0A672FVY0_SALFA
MIRCLPAEVQGRLRSGVAIPSLQQCVEELVLNSIDAGSTCVGVRVDMEAFKVQVIDNGAGMSAEDMERVGNRYHTSKCSSLQDLDDLRWYGFRGEALASVVSLATLVEISSRSRSSVKTHVKLFKEGKGVDVFEAETTRPSAGTTVTVCNFFHNMPVRRRRMDAVLEGERIRHRVEAVSLMHPSVSFTMKNDCTEVMTVQLPKARDTYHRFVQIHGLGRAHKLREVSYTHKQFEVTGHLGVEGHYNNSLQFLYVNERLLLKTRIHKLLNALLRRLSSSHSKQENPEEPAVVRSPKVKRSQEVYGVYIVNIKCSYSEYDICLEPAKTLIEFRDWDGVLLCIEEAVKAFMRKENLVAEVSQDDLEGISPTVFGSERSEQEKESVQDAQGFTDIPTMNCSVATKLASESVHRRRTDDCRSQSIDCMESSADESEEVEQKIENTEILNSEQCSDEPQCDSATPEAASHHDENEEEAVTVSETGEEAEVLLQSTEIHGAALREKETQSNCEASASGEKSTHSLIQQTQSDLINCEQTSTSKSLETHEQISLCPKKIRVSEPYVHESLQVLDEWQSKTPAENLSASKRKISLEAVRGPSSLTLYRDSMAAVPAKAPRIVSCRKLSTCDHSGSLDKFRRMFVKPDELKLPFPKTQTENSVLNRDSVCPEDQRLEDFSELHSSSRSPPTLSAFTKLKPGSPRNKGKASLASKLHNLKQQTGVSEVSAQVSKTVCEDVSGCKDDDDPIQDRDKDENPSDLVLNPDPVSGLVTNPQHEEEEEEAAAASGWMPHYDTAVGKTVYVNRVTGLSRYEEPAMDEADVRCTSDVSNMAVCVISETGMEYRCYPFQADLVLPFLPKSRPERVISAGPDCRDVGGDGSNSLSSLYSKWTNPVFVHPPMVGVDISSGQADGLVVKIHNILFPYRFSKAMIHSMKVINQVDKKFLACLIDTSEEKKLAHTEAEGNLLVLVDQHAAHERVRLESLVADSYEDDPDVAGERRLCSSNILPPLQISVTEEELRLLRCSHLRSLGLEVTFPQAADPQVLVAKVPLCFTEKEHNELKRGRTSVIKTIVEEYIQEQIELLRSTGRVRGTLPLTVLKVLASLACHGAVKFNSPLSKDECHSLISSLSSCQLPFQCAHGRPSIAPLVDVLHLDRDQTELQKPNLKKLRRMYKAWQLFGNR